MQPDDALGDDEATSRLLPPDDRLWRHPSEVAAHGMPLGAAYLAGPARTAPAGRWSGPAAPAVALLGGLIGGLLTVGVTAAAGGFGTRTRTVTVPAVEQVVAPASPAAPWPAAVADVVRRVGPSVVEVRAGGPGAPGASGSGVVFRSDGHVLTTTQLVLRAPVVTVVLGGGVEVPGRVVGLDRESDVAVVKVERPGLPSALLGSAASVEVGSLVLVIGPPVPPAVGPSVSAGVVGGLWQEVPVPGTRPLPDIIRTDVPRSPASAGCAVVDVSGAVVGITTTAGRPPAGPGGLGSAIPIDVARDVAGQLIARGRVERVWLGIEGEDVDTATGTELGVAAGALVRHVQRDSPAGHAGISSRDVITSVDGTPVRSMGALKVALRRHRPGEVVDLGVNRRGQQRPVRVTLRQRPAAPP